MQHPSRGVANMTWLTALIAVALVAAFAAVTGLKPKGTRHVAHTSLMGVARIVLLVIVVICVYLVLRARTGGEAPASAPTDARRRPSRLVQQLVQRVPAPESSATSLLANFLGRLRRDELPIEQQV